MSDFCDPVDCTHPGSSVLRISQAKYWGSLPFPSSSLQLAALKKFSGPAPGGETETAHRVDELNRIESPRIKAARVHRTADLGGACCTEGNLQRFAEGPAGMPQRHNRSEVYMRRLPSEKLTGTVPAAHPQLQLVN